MSVSAPCEICASGDVDDTCGRCGRLVCDRHFDEESGWCVDCAAETDSGSGGPAVDEQSDDVDTYRF